MRGGERDSPGSQTLPRIPDDGNIEVAVSKPLFTYPLRPHPAAPRWPYPEAEEIGAPHQRAGSTECGVLDPAVRRVRMMGVLPEQYLVPRRCG